MKRLLLTGASRGLGRYLCEYLSRGYEITALTRNENVHESVSSRVYCDVSNRESVSEAIRQLDSTLFDAAIFCAGGPIDRPMVGEQYPSWEAVTVLNYLSIVALSTALLEKNDSTRMVLISSDSVATGNSSPAYCAAKSALSAYGRQLKKYGHNTLLLEPAAFEGLDNYWDQVRLEDPDRYAKVKQKQVEGKFKTVEDIAKPIIDFLV